ncbi:MAG: enolase C-terminal domain-like protein [Candidatus Dormibacteria bacterium]
MPARIPFSVRLREPVGAVAERHGWLVKGRAGWGEVSPLPGWGPEQVAAAERAATEASARSFPPPIRTVVEVNAMVPRVAAGLAARMAIESGCRTVKVKVGDAGGEDRVRAVRDAVGAGVRIRLDANSTWDLDTAERQLRRLARLDIELIEDPVAGMEELARLRRRQRVPIAAEMCIRTPSDGDRLRRLAAADAVVLKPQRLGGVRAALRTAEAAGMPAIASSALETSVGLAAVVALAASLPAGPFAHGVGTALLLAEDVTEDPLVPVGGFIAPRRVAPDATRLRAAAG